MDEITVGFWVLFALLQLADAATTYVIVVKLKGVELNPVLRKVFDLIGVVPGLILFKSGMIYFFWHFREQIPVWLWLAVTVLYAWVINHNVKQIKSKQ